MRQVFLEFPWVHAPSSSDFFTFFKSIGQYRKLEKGQAIYNGGVDGEVAWILSGLFAFRMQDAKDREHYFTLVPAGRMIGNVDAFTASVVNILDVALRPSEVLLISRHDFVTFLNSNAKLSFENTGALIREHESDMEGMFASMTDTLEVRIVKLLAALTFRDRPRESFNWPQTLETLKPLPIPFGLNNAEIAKTVCASRTAVSLAMNRFERDGLISRHGNDKEITPALFATIRDWLTDCGGPKPITSKKRRVHNKITEE